MPCVDAYVREVWAGGWCDHDVATASGSHCVRCVRYVLIGSIPLWHSMARYRRYRRYRGSHQWSVADTSCVAAVWLQILTRTSRTLLWWVSFGSLLVPPSESAGFLS